MKKLKLIPKLLLIFLILSIILISTSCDTLNTTCHQSEPSQTNVNYYEKSIEVHFIDVGQGDCTLVTLPNGETLLIDAGDNDYGTEIVQYLKDLSILKLDYVIATHPHADHIGGLDKVIENFVIGRIYMPDISNNTKTYENVLKAISNKNIPVTEAKSDVAILENNDLKLFFVAPVTKTNDINNMSAVLKIIYRDISFLFTGDAESKSESEMLSSKIDLKADVLKVAHHGSDTSSTKKFISAVAPKYAIISVGSNLYGHPSNHVIQRFLKRNTEIFRTDQIGSIIIESDGNSISIKDINRNIITYDSRP